MIQTLETLRSIIIDDDRKLTLEEIATKYKEGLNPSLLAVSFEKTYKLTIKLSSRYYGLSQDDIASISLELLDQALQKHDINLGRFNTYYGTLLLNRFRQETQKMNTEKRGGQIINESYNFLIENGFDCPTKGDYTESELIYYLEQINLTESELNYCKLVIAENSNSAIAEILGVSMMRISHIKNSLRKKLTPDSLII